MLQRIALVLCLSLPAWAVASGVAVGDAAPAVELPTLPANGDMSLQSLRGKVVYLDFWASWCGPCRVSFPLLAQLRDELAASGFEVLAINVDEVEADALQFLSEIPVSYPVVRDGEGATPQAFGILGMPTGFLIDRDGVVRDIHQGFRKSDIKKLRSAVIELLGE